MPSILPYGPVKEQSADDVKTMGPGGDGPEEARNEDTETLVDDQEETCESADGATSSLTQDDEDSHQRQIPPFMLGAIWCSSSIDSCQRDFLSPHPERAIVPYRSCPGKLTLKVTDWTC